MTEMSFLDTTQSDQAEFTEDNLQNSIATSISTKRKAVISENAIDTNREIPDVIVDDSRDALLTDFAKATLRERYLSPGESYQDRFANCVRYYADDQAHAQRLYEYISKLWCMPPTPILSNGGTKKGNLISCFINDMPDSLDGIVNTWVENIWLGAAGGGIGTYIGGLREVGSSVKRNGKTSGAMTFTKVIDSLVACISQGSNRRGAGAVYMDISHPEIYAFMDMRRPSGGDPNRKALNIHHGVLISDKFMNAVNNDEDFDLISPKDGSVKETVRARDLMQKLLLARLDQGEPYILFEDAIKRATPEHHKRSGLYPKSSNLCIEITLPTGVDHHGVDRTAVCCLFQPNAEKFEEWKDDKLFFSDIGRFLDNVLQDFIDNAGEKFVKARYSASRERSIGVGMMGFHGFLQSKGIPIESALAKVWNKKIFGHLKKEMDRVSVELAHERGACPDAAEHGIMERFSYKVAIAPTASVSIICNASAGIDFIPANVYTHKTLDGSFIVKNKYLQKLLQEKGKDTDEVWSKIGLNEGSVADLDFLTEDEKILYKTSFEIDQRWAIELAADRVPYVCQSQSLNLAIRSDCSKRDLWKIHELAWKKGIKSLYYLRSISAQRAHQVGHDIKNDIAKPIAQKTDYEECLSCQ